MDGCRMKNIYYYYYYYYLVCMWQYGEFLFSKLGTPLWLGLVIIQLAKNPNLIGFTSITYLLV
jgi:hypothetical protein